MKKQQNANLIVESFWGIYNKIPIHVLEITNDLFPVKFVYLQKGYKNLIFSERLSRIEFI